MSTSQLERPPVGGDVTVPLPDGRPIPLLGLGTWQLRGDHARSVVAEALRLGYRHLDTATVYGNEAAVGDALATSDVPREDVFVTTKLKPDEWPRARHALEHSLDLLGLDAVDLWLLHWPPGGDEDVRAWEAMLALREEGLARSVGVSNVPPATLDALVAATGEVPAVNQVKWSPHRYDRARLEHSRQVGTVLEGYSPFKAGDLSEEMLTTVAQTHGVTPAQVVLRWHVEHDVPVIPKTATPARLAENADIWRFSLTDEEVRRIDALGGGRR